MQDRETISPSSARVKIPSFSGDVASNTTVGIMHAMQTIGSRFLVSLFMCTLGLTASCTGTQTTDLNPTLASPSATPLRPTPTTEPLAAWVNGEPIRLVDYEQEVARFEEAQAASGIDLATLEDYQSQILQALIDRRLLAQGAKSVGIEVDQETLDSKITSLATELGGNEAMGVWLAETGYTLEAFKSALEEEMLAARMVEQIIAQVPETAEQVHARHILGATREEAENLLDQLTAGQNFAELARLYSLDPSSRIAGGDLSWFAEGYLLIPEVEIAAFMLQPGEVSEVVESSLGFHIVQTLERAERLLSADMLQTRRESEVEQWLASQREAAEIYISSRP
jgi:parvulin-like peptidyl-prolyl isomerase